MTRGRFYERPFKADRFFYGTRFPKSIGCTWRGSQIGLQKQGLLGRSWYGAPDELTVLGSAAVSYGGLAGDGYVSEGGCDEEGRRDGGDMADLEIHLLFRADFPDDAEFDGSGEVLVPGGREIARHLAARLRERGLEATEPEQHSFYGWAFEVPRGKGRIWCMLQYVEPWLLVTDPRGSLLGKLFGGSLRDEHREVLGHLREVLSSAPRLSGREAFTEQEFARRAAAP